MHARIATARVRAGSAAAVQRGWEELFEDYRQSGVCHGLVSMFSPEDDLAVTLTLWESSEAADAVAPALREKAAAMFADLMLEPPTIVLYDLLLTTAIPATRPSTD